MGTIYPPPDFTYDIYQARDSAGDLTAINATPPIVYSTTTFNISDTPASAIANGYVTTGAQTFAGTKTFNAIPQTAVVPTAPNDLCNLAYVGASVSGITATLPILYNPGTSVISEQAASATTDGYISTGAQQIEGTKTFISGVTEFQNTTGGTPCTITTTVGGATTIESPDTMTVQAAAGKNTILKTLTTGNLSMVSDFGTCRARATNNILELYGNTGVDMRNIGTGDVDIQNLGTGDVNITCTTGDVNMDSIAGSEIHTVNNNLSTVTTTGYQSHTAETNFLVKSSTDDVDIEGYKDVCIDAITGKIIVTPAAGQTGDLVNQWGFTSIAPTCAYDPGTTDSLTRKSYVDTTAASITTTKGDICTYSTLPDRLPVGTNGNYLKADSTETTGLDWVAPIVNTKGDIFTHNTTVEARLPVGTNGDYLKADSTETTGLDWVAPIVNTKGDIFTHSTTGEDRLPVGTNGLILEANSAETTGLKWVTNPTTPVTTKGDIYSYSTVPYALALGSNLPGYYVTPTADGGYPSGLRWRKHIPIPWIIYDEKSSGTNGGNAAAATWNIRQFTSNGGGPVATSISTPNFN